MKLQQALYLQTSMLASQLNSVYQNLYINTGGLIPLRQVNLPPPPFEGDKLTLNNIEITNSTVGVINLGRAQNIDSVISMMHGEGSSKLADALTTFTEAVLRSTELTEELRAETIEAIELLAAQTRIEPDKRSNLIAAIVERVGNVARGASTVVTAWERLEPLIKIALGAS